MLFYSPTVYAQLILGPGAALEELVAAISRDSRHRLLWVWRGTLRHCGVGAGLPMGYVSQAEALRTPEIAPLSVAAHHAGHDDAPDLAVALSDAAQFKYPSLAKVS